MVGQTGQLSSRSHDIHSRAQHLDVATGRWQLLGLVERGTGFLPGTIEFSGSYTLKTKFTLFFSPGRLERKNCVFFP